MKTPLDNIMTPVCYILVVLMVDFRCVFTLLQHCTLKLAHKQGSASVTRILTNPQ